VQRTPKLPKCARKGCKQRVSRVGHKTCSPFCNSALQREQSIAAAGRHVSGTESAEDVLRRENAHLRADVRKTTHTLEELEKRSTVEDRLVENIFQFIQAHPYRPVIAKPAVKPGKASDHEMMILLSDAHFPEVVDPAATMGIAYNADICKRRIEHIRNTVIRYRDLRASAYNVRKLTIAVNGDMLSGSIHEELEITNEQPISQALVDMAYMLHDVGLSTAEVFPEVQMIVMPGNHPRISQKPRSKQKWNNWEYVLGHFVAALSHNKYSVSVPKDLVYRHRIFEKTIGLTHGDGAKVQSFAGIPFYSMERRQTKLQAMLRSIKQSQLDMLCYGHFHQLIFQEGMGCSLVVNGSVKGPDEYVMNTMYAGEAPVQALLTFHARHGLTDLSRINLAQIGAQTETAAA
jgi:hypothetical protein